MRFRSFLEGKAAAATLVSDWWAVRWADELRVRESKETFSFGKQNQNSTTLSLQQSRKVQGKEGFIDVNASGRYENVKVHTTTQLNIRAQNYLLSCLRNFK